MNITDQLSSCQPFMDPKNESMYIGHCPYKQFIKNYLNSFIIIQEQYDFICNNDQSSATMMYIATCVSALMMITVLATMAYKMNSFVKKKKVD